MIQTIDAIKSHPVMIQVLKDAYGGIMYDMANRNKYDTADLLQKWESLTPAEKENADGLITGAINFLKS